MEIRPLFADEDFATSSPTGEVTAASNILEGLYFLAETDFPMTPKGFATHGILVWQHQSPPPVPPCGEDATMNAPKIIAIKKSVFEGNEKRADLTRAELREKRIFLVNLLSAPGSGKTTLVIKTIEALMAEMKMAVLNAETDSDIDAQNISKTGINVVKIPSKGMCHLNAALTHQGLEKLEGDGLDLVMLENIGNLICTAEFDTGASQNVLISSIPEGDDKPLKYPFAFSVADLVLVNKIDAADHFDFDLQRFTEQLRKVNCNAVVIPVSAKTGEGMEQWYAWLRNKISVWKTA